MTGCVRRREVRRRLRLGTHGPCLPAGPKTGRVYGPCRRAVFTGGQKMTVYANKHGPSTRTVVWIGAREHGCPNDQHVGHPCSRPANTESAADPGLGKGFFRQSGGGSPPLRAALRLARARVLCQMRAPYRPITAHKIFHSRQLRARVLQHPV